MKNNKIKKLESKKITFSKSGKILRKLSAIIAFYLNKININPNQVTLFRVFVFGGISIFLFYSNNYILNLLGLFTIVLCYFFDLVDGDLARNYNKKSKLGSFLDINLDSFILNLIILTITIKLLNNNYGILYVYGGIAALFGITMSSKMTNLFEGKFEINCVEGNNKIEEFL